MDEPRPRLEHETPEWVRHDAEFFVTICALPRGTNQLCLPASGPKLLESIQHYHRKHRWFCHIVVLMPDHLHMVVSFPDIPNFAKVIGDWKRWTSLHVGITWQEDFFEHRIRNEDQDKWKADYILRNPVRAGLAARGEDWPFKWIADDGW